MTELHKNVVVHPIYCVRQFFRRPIKHEKVELPIQRRILFDRVELEDHRQISEKGFNGRIFRCIDVALSKLGETSKVALYYQIASKYGLDSAEFGSRPLEVANHLHDLLGDVGFSFIQKLIIREICTSFKLRPMDGVRLSEVVSEARKKYLREN
jgi:hypothetical protein